MIRTRSTLAWRYPALLKHAATPAAASRRRRIKRQANRYARRRARRCCRACIVGFAA